MAQSSATSATEPESSGVWRDDDVPLGVQLAWRLRALIRSGQLPAGSRLPGVRELASGAEVNVNTARAVYLRLEEEGLAVSRHGHGTFVADHPGIAPALEQLAAEAAESAAALGLDPRELASTLYVASAPGNDELPIASFTDNGELTEADERAARRSLRAQIARLEAQLADYPEAIEASDEPPPRAFPAVAGLGQLETVRDQLIEKLKDARLGAERRGRRQGAARAHLEEMAADPAAHRREVVSNEELGEPGCASWEVGPAWGPVGALMKWWRVKVSSGCP